MGGSLSWNRIEDLDFAEKVALVRVDANVPMQEGKVTDETRLVRIKPTVDALANLGARSVLLSHFGRPKDAPDPAFSLEPIVPALSKALDRAVHFAPDCIGDVAQKAVEDLQPGGVLLLENTRFHPGEKTNDPEFSASLSRLGDIFVSDAFSSAHRAHASVTGIAEHLPSCAGRALEAELTALDAALGSPAHPVIAVVGGAKVSTKLALLENLIAPTDAIIIGGGMANTFLAAKGYQIGQSLYEPDLIEKAKEIGAAAEAASCDLLLPLDVVVAEAFAENAPHAVYRADRCPATGMILDAGPETINALKLRLQTVKTVIWNGPLGAFEVAPFDAATNAVAQEVANLTAAGRMTSVAGGGDTVAALNQSGAAADFTYISTAGGAFLEWMEGKTLPGVAALMGERG